MPRQKFRQRSVDSLQRKNKQSNGNRRGEEIVSNDDDKSSRVVPYSIDEDPNLGRYLKAASNLTAGQLILKESPLVVGPSQDQSRTCIGCYSPLDNWEKGNSSRCPKCSHPLCSEKCPGIGKKTGHSIDECAVLSRAHIIGFSSAQLSQIQEVITPLRCLILRSTDASSWNRLSQMEAHTDIRRNIPGLWQNNQHRVADVIRKLLGLQEFDDDTIHHVCGVLEVNAFEVGEGLRALYPTAYLFAHDCVPNVRHSNDRDFNMTFWATTPVAEGSRLNVSYTFILQGTLGRMKHLERTKFFSCACKRCEDATELGTNISALLCPICRKGLVLSTNPLDANANWICTEKTCLGYIVSADSVKNLTQRLFLELDSISGNDIAGYENFLLKHSATLHDKHYLCLSAMHCLFQLYGKIEGYLITDLNERQLRRKIEICETLLEAFATLEPGLTKQKGLISYEMQAPLMVLLQQKYAENKISKIELKSKLQEIIKYLNDAIKTLNIEPAGSSEAEVAAVAEDALNSLLTWRQLISKK